MARKDNYELRVKPYLDKVADMALVMSEEQIAITLNVSYSSFQRYKEAHNELRQALKKGRRELVLELKSVLIQKAKGFHYEESKTIKEKGKETRTEVYRKYCPPDVAALNLLLKNYDKENWANDPQALKLREKELELQERKIEQNEW